MSWKPHTLTRGPLKGQYFATQQAYQNALARAKGFRSYAAWRAAPVRTPPGKLSASEYESRKFALRAVSLMRTKNLSLTAASRQVGIDPATTKRYAGRALEREGRAYRPTPYDKLTRQLRVLTPEGQISLPIGDSRTASQISRYWNAVEHYLATGDTSQLEKFRGKFFRVQKRAYPFIVDTHLLDELAAAGELHFEDLYDDGVAA
jgi:hypothetical protein